MARKQRRPGNAGAGDPVARARREVKRRPDSAPPLFRLVRLLLEQGDPAVNELLPRLEGFPGYTDGWCELGDTLLRLGKHEAALTAYERALAGDNPPGAARVGAARCLLAADKPRAAADRLGAGTEGDAAHQAVLGQALYAIGDAGGAAPALACAVDRDPRDAASWYRLGLARQDLGNPAAAAAAYGEALSLRPDLQQAAFNRGVALQDAGELDAAIAAYREAVRLDPECTMRAIQSLTSAATGMLFLSPSAARRFLGAE